MHRDQDFVSDRNWTWPEKNPSGFGTTCVHCFAAVTLRSNTYISQRGTILHPVEIRPSIDLENKVQRFDF